MSWNEVQGRLAEALRADRPGSGTEHVLISIPSMNLSSTLLKHYVDRLPAMEHRYLLGVCTLARLPECEIVLVCSSSPAPEVVEYHLATLPETVRDDCRRRFHLVSVDDDSPRGLTAKLLDRPDLVDQIRERVAGRPAYIDPWNVTDDELRLAEALDVPVNGTSPELWRLGGKSVGRRMFRQAGVPVAEGAEDVRCPDDVLAAVEEIRRCRPEAPGVVVKIDDSAAGDGNRVLRFGPGVDVRGLVDGLSPQYLEDLEDGGIVEELVSGTPFSSPSVQADLVPDGPPRVLSTHEQVLGGEDGQVYLGCRFPADDEYAAELGALGLASAQRLADSGALGRISVDFAVGREPGGAARVCALEVNLRKGGTTHPFTALRHLVPGHYDVEAARWVTRDGTHRFYEATDNLVNASWLGREPREVVESIRSAGLDFDHASGTGVVLHMLSGLAIDGRMGLIAFGTSREHAANLFADAATALRH